MHYSFSQLCSYDRCPYGYYLEKIAKDDDGNPFKMEENAFSQLGSIVHELIDAWAKGEVKIEDLPDEYEGRYLLQMNYEYPRFLAKKGYADTAHDKCLEYFKNFDGFKGYKVLEAEKLYETTIKDRTFIGIIDMVLEDESNGNIIILDHKSKSIKTFKSSEDEMYRQQLLYSKFIFESTGRYPDILMFNLFKENGLLKSRPFDIENYKDTIKWAEDIINKIESNSEMDWLERKQTKDFFCNNICSARKYCL